MRVVRSHGPFYYLAGPRGGANVDVLLHTIQRTVKGKNTRLGAAVCELYNDQYSSDRDETTLSGTRGIFQTYLCFQFPVWSTFYQTGVDCHQ